MHRLLWRDQLIAIVVEVRSDFPWMCGKFVPASMDPTIRVLLEWIEHRSKTDDDLSKDPPFPAKLLEDWYIQKPDGTKIEIMIPIVDFAEGTIEWR